MSKDKLISFKIEEDIKQTFEEVCQTNHSTASHELRILVHGYINRHEGAKVLLSGLKSKR